MLLLYIFHASMGCRLSAEIYTHLQTHTYMYTLYYVLHTNTHIYSTNAHYPISTVTYSKGKLVSGVEQTEIKSILAFIICLVYLATSHMSSLTTTKTRWKTLKTKMLGTRRTKGKTEQKSIFLFRCACLQDNSNLYMVLEFISGGEMFSHLRRLGKFRYYRGTVEGPFTLCEINHCDFRHMVLDYFPFYFPSKNFPSLITFQAFQSHQIILCLVSNGLAT